MSFLENYMAIIDSIWCGGEAKGKSVVVVSSLVLSRFNLISSSRPKWILDASVSSLMMFSLLVKSFIILQRSILHHLL